MPVTGTTTEAHVLERLLTERYSCRRFLPTQVPEETVRALLTAAQRTASWCNSQPWEVIVTAGAETERLRDHLVTQVMETAGVYDIAPPGRYEGVYRERRRASGFALYDSVGIRRDDADARLAQAMENYRFFGAPHVAIVTSEGRLGSYGYVDCGGYVANFLLAAQSRGVATIAQAAIAGYANIVREHFDLPGTHHVVCAISFGYADKEHPINGFRTDRADVREVARLLGFPTDRHPSPAE